MAPLTNGLSAGKKRKIVPNDTTTSKKKLRRAKATSVEFLPRRLEQLEVSLSGEGTSDQERQAQMAELISMFEVESRVPEGYVEIAICLCRVFSRMMAAGTFPWTKGVASIHSSQWQAASYLRYHSIMQKVLGTGLGSIPTTMFKLSMRMLKEESLHSPHDLWLSESFTGLMSAVIETKDGDVVRKLFADEYLQKYPDCCYHSLEEIGNHVRTSKASKQELTSVVSLLSNLGATPTSAADVSEYFAPPRNLTKKRTITPTAIKRQAESAWRAVLASQELDTDLRKTLLRQCTRTMLPWMTRPENLMDFLTDSYNLGGSTSLLALSGLFHLINTKNLDYPSFYPKLYSLLDADLLHSRHRSRFLRLLNTFLSSTHLPASLIASFIKRLSRLSLFAPPAAIVAIIPYIYNLLKAHSTCTFMIHRPPHPPYITSMMNLGQDPFDMSERNPQLTRAIDSSLWELETLQSHYHPNVASLARIISEQFTKQQYNLEDFLDHGYASMVESELSKEAKKAPVVEWKIPKTILTQPTEVQGQAEIESRSLIQELWTFP